MSTIRDLLAALRPSGDVMVWAPRLTEIMGVAYDVPLYLNKTDLISSLKKLSVDGPIEFYIHNPDANRRTGRVVYIGRSQPHQKEV